MRHAVARSQSVHQLSGLCPNRHAHRGARRGSQHRARPDFHFRTAPRRARRCYRNRTVAVSVCCMGCQVFNRQKSRVKAGFPRFLSGLALYPAHYRARHRQLCHVVYGYARAGGVQFHAARFRRRPVHQRHDRT